MSAIVISCAHVRICGGKVTVEERSGKAGTPIIHVDIRSSAISSHRNLDGWKPSLLAIIYGVADVEHRIVALAGKLSACIQDLLGPRSQHHIHSKLEVSSPSRSSASNGF